MGTRGMGTVLNLALGSIARRVIHLADVPVTLVTIPLPDVRIDNTNDRTVTPEVHRVFLAVNGSPSALQAVEYVCKLPLSNMPVDVQLLSCPLPILSGNVRQFVSQATIKAYYRDEGGTALNAAKAMLQAKGLNFKCHIVAGHAAQVVVEQADKLRCTQIVMGTRGLGAVASVLLRSVAFKVVQLANVPVTLLK